MVHLGLRLELMQFKNKEFIGELYLGTISFYINFLKDLESKLDEEIDMRHNQKLTVGLNHNMAAIEKINSNDLPVAKKNDSLIS